MRKEVKIEGRKEGSKDRRNEGRGCWEERRKGSENQGNKLEE